MTLRPLADLQDRLLSLAQRAPAVSSERRTLLFAATSFGHGRPDPAAVTQVDDIRALLADVVDWLGRATKAGEASAAQDLRQARNLIEELLDGVAV